MLLLLSFPATPTLSGQVEVLRAASKLVNVEDASAALGTVPRGARSVSRQRGRIATGVADDEHDLDRRSGERPPQHRPVTGGVRARSKVPARAQAFRARPPVLRENSQDSRYVP